MRKIAAIGLSALAFLATGCFTGVESTPKITAKEVKKQNVTDTPEQHVLDAITAEAPGRWKPGKRFYVTDSRAARAAWRVDPLWAGDSLAGKTVELAKIDTVPTLTSSHEVQLTFSVKGDSTILEYRTGMTPTQWREAASYVLPHIIDLDVVDKVNDRLSGNTYYITTARRQTADGNDTIGTKYQAVRVLDVTPATEATPFQVNFVDDEGHLASVFMTMGDTPTARRNFETMFSIENPRVKYKHINDDTWNLIRHGKLRLAMTPEECRLALGSPDTYTRVPTTAGMVERWNYTNGVYLVFEDGVLAAFRQ